MNKGTDTQNKKVRNEKLDDKKREKKSNSVQGKDMQKEKTKDDNTVKEEEEIKDVDAKVKNKKNRIIQVLVTVGIVFLGIGGYVSYKIDAFKDKLYPGQYLEETNVSGYTKEELQELLGTLEDKNKDSKLLIQANDNRYEKLVRDFDIDIDNKEELIKDMMLYGKNKPLLEKINLLLFSGEGKKNTKNNKIYSIKIKYDENLVKEYVKQIKLEVDKKKIEPSLKMIDYGIFKVSEGQDGYSLNAEDLINKINREVEKNKTDNVRIKALVEVKKKKIERELLETVNSKISSFSTTYSTGSGRSRNVELGLSRVNKTVVLPGEQFSLNKTVLPRTKANGYKGAAEYDKGKVIQGIGGGICQVSTTVYGAELRAGILPIERHPHSMTVPYAPIGLDAAISGNSADLKFINTHKYPIYIYSYASNGRARVEFWSNENVIKGIHYEPKSYTKSPLRADAYLYGYDSEGNKVYKKYLGRSNYKPQVKHD